jgi:hypothetical protein
MTAQEAVAFLASKKRTMELIAAVFASLLIVCSARAGELFRYRYNAVMASLNHEIQRQ